MMLDKIPPISYDKFGGDLMAYIEDYSLTLGDITLAQYGVMTGRPYTNYAGGRRVCGLVAALSGTARYALSDGSLLFLAAGEAAFIPAGTQYTVCAEGNVPFLHYTINFTVLHGSGQLSQVNTSQKIEIITMRHRESWISRLDELLRAWNGRRSGYALRCQAALYTLLADFFDERMRGAVKGDAYEKTLPALQLIEANYAAHLTLNELAAACALSPTHFRRLFRQVYNASPIDYLLSLRLKRADDLLLSGRYTVAEAAAQTGFQDESYFCRCFKQHMGISPGKRASARENF